ncbi:MAG: hypothetical protein ABI857_07460 [Acidobacteriota bacterium]
MKKLIQIGSVLSLIVVFTAVATFAQAGFGTDVNIPFAFTIGDRSYEAGEYNLKIDKLAIGTATLAIRDPKTDAFQRVLLSATGDSTAGDIRLVFDLIDGQGHLTTVKTPDRTYAVIRSRSERNAAKVRKEKASEIGGSASSF